MVAVNVAKKIPARAAVVARPIASDRLAGSGYDKRVLTRAGFTGKLGETLKVPSADGSVDLLIGAGPAADLDAAALRRVAVEGVRAAGTNGTLVIDHAEATSALDPAVATQALAEGALLGGYRFERYLSEPDKRVGRVTLVGSGDRAEAAGLKRALAIGEAVAFARDLVNEPGGAKTPEVIAELIAGRASDAGIDVTVWDLAEIESERLGGLVAVNLGSANEPRFVRLHYKPEGAVARVAIVGKGITFDSGGLSIKPADGMMTMKCDMAGAAAAVAAVLAAAALEIPVEVTTYTPFTDNMTGGNAQRPGDVFTARNGTTVEVLNTDAEGRLVLADALSLASEDGPDLIIDLATLTGACMVALGDKVAGVLSNDDALSAELVDRGTAVGERLWPLPLVDEYRQLLDSGVADVKNIGGRYGGAITAGLFLREFVAEGTPWAHLDIAGPAFFDADHPLGPKGATGFGVRTLVEFLEGRVAVAAEADPGEPEG